MMRVVETHDRNQQWLGVADIMKAEAQDAAHAVLTSDAATTTGNFFIDEEVLARAGVTDLDKYSVVPGSKQLLPDLFL